MSSRSGRGGGRPLQNHRGRPPSITTPARSPNNQHPHPGRGHFSRSSSLLLHNRPGRGHFSRSSNPGRGRGSGNSGSRSSSGSGTGSARPNLPRATVQPRRQLSPKSLSHMEIEQMGLEFAGFDSRRRASAGEKLNVERFKAHYGVGPITVEALFNDLLVKFPDFDYRLGLMAMNFLKCYETEHVMAGRWKNCEDFIRPKVWEYVGKIQSLKASKIVLGGFDSRETILFGLDCFDCNVQEFRLDPSAKWYSFKSNHSGLRYELATAIRRAKMVWLSGPHFPSTHDITIFRGGKPEVKLDDRDQNALFFRMKALGRGKKCVADSALAGEPDMIITSTSDHDKDFRDWVNRVKDREETIHSRLKSFNVLANTFRHGKGTKDKMEKHKACTESVAVIVQYDFDCGHPPFEVDGTLPTRKVKRS